MGIQKWFLKNGPGAPGSNAKAIAKSYNKFVAGNDEDGWGETFLKVFQIRRMAYEMFNTSAGNLFNEVDLDKLILYSNGDLRLFAFQLMYLETEQFRMGIKNAGQKDFSLTIVVIDETIQKTAPNAIVLDNEALVAKIFNFIKNPLLLQ